MSKNGKLFWAICIFIGLAKPIQAQSFLSEVVLEKSSVYVGEPIQVTIKVYTSTWFSSGVDLGNIKVPGAFTVYFRPVSTSINRDGKTYVGVDLIYHVFPFETGELVFPSLDIEVESPPPGDFKGTFHQVKTAEKTILVKPAPSSFASNDWLVANGLSVKENWSVPVAKQGVRQIKVGDVVERQVKRTAFGTISELIPPISWDTVSGVSEYPSRSIVSNNKNKSSISATRTETMRYLFEEEGEVTLPELVFTWYNPSQEKLFKRTLKSVTFQVAPNPDLGILTSIKDSLQVVQEQEMIEFGEKGPWTILGMSWKRFLLYVSLGLIILIFLVNFFRRGLAWQKNQRNAYLVSESYYFQQFKKALQKKNEREIVLKLYQWIDSLDLKEPTASFFAKHFGSEALLRQVEEMEYKWNRKNASIQVGRFEMEIKDWVIARKNFKNPASKRQSSWINP